jgi:hypothetical protein
MATLYKNGKVLADYTRFVTQRDGSQIGYIFRLMSNGWVLVRPHKAGGRWRRFRKDGKLSHIQMTIDTFLRSQLDNVFN